MAEEKAKTKKSQRLKKVFKTISLGLLALLIIAGLILGAPWKVITLLVGILLTCTVLPKPARKWFWSLVGLIVLVLVTWVLLPDDNEGWIPYTFDKELAAIEDRRAIPDSENAALKYDQLLDTYDANDFKPNMIEPNEHNLVISEPWTDTKHPRVAKWLDGKSELIDKLIEASQINQCRFPVAGDIALLGDSFNRLSPMRSLAWLLIISGNNNMGSKRIFEALEKYEAALRISEHLCQQPTMTYSITGFAIQESVFKQLSRFVVEGKLSTEYLKQVSVGDINDTWQFNISSIIEVDKLMIKNMLASMTYQTNAKGEIRLSRDPAAKMNAQYQLLETSPPTYWRRKLEKAMVIYRWLFTSTNPNQLAKDIDAEYLRLYRMAEADFDWQQDPPRLSLLSILRKRKIFSFRAIVEGLVAISEPTYYMFHDMYLKHLALKRGLKILVAIRNYEIENGTWPENLGQIRSHAPAEVFNDPATGGELVYENHGERFSLYCEAANIWPK